MCSFAREGGFILPDISTLLPHVYPFVMVDRVVSCDESGLVAVKNITAGEWALESASNAAFPETLCIEAAAQAALLFYRLTKAATLAAANALFVLAKAEATFHDQAFVGDQLVMKSGATRLVGNKGYMDVALSVAEKPIADVTVYFGMVEAKR